MPAMRHGADESAASRPFSILSTKLLREPARPDGRVLQPAPGELARAMDGSGRWSPAARLGVRRRRLSPRGPAARVGGLRAGAPCPRLRPGRSTDRAGPRRALWPAAIRMHHVLARAGTPRRPD